MAVTPSPSVADQLERHGTLLMPGVWDPLSARIAQLAGFSTVFVSGYCVAGSLLGMPDTGALTQTEMVDVVRRIRAATPDLTLVVDADTGYGNVSNVARTVGLWEAAGADGLFLEDQVWPKRCGHMAGKEVVPRAEWLAKLRAALATRTTMHITARTDARAPLGIEEAIERGRMAADLGVDAVFVEAPESLAELEQIAAALPNVTRVANMVETGRTPLLTPIELHDLGFDVVVSPLSILFSGVRAMIGGAAALVEHGSLRDHLASLVSFEEFTDLVGLPAQQRFEAEFN